MNSWKHPLSTNLLLFIVSFLIHVGFITPSHAEPIISKTETFQKQIGLGINTIPMQITFLKDNSPFYTGGAKLDILGRLHPHITAEFSLGMTGIAYPYAGLIFSHISLGIRYLITSFRIKSGVSLSPYLVATFQPTLWTFQAGDSIARITSYDVILGFVPGVGTELRLNHHISLSVDIRTYLGASIFGYVPPPRLITNLCILVGGAYYF